MTNNDDLALKLKAAAEKATPGNWYVDNDFDVCSENYGFVGELHGDNLVMNADFIATASPANILALLAERDADKKRIADLEDVCAESYQVVGALADAAGVFETSGAVSKALDNLSAAKMVHEDVLPFGVEARTVSVKLPEGEWEIDHSAGRPILTYKKCSVIEAEDAYFVMALIAEHRAAAGINLEVGDQP